MKQFAVIGLGRFGASVATTLCGLGHQVLGIDESEARIQAMVDRLTHVVQADATDEDALRSLGLRNFDAVIVAIGHDLEASTLITLMLKDMGVREVVAKASSDLHGKVLEKIGADRVVYPERDMGVKLAHSLLSPRILDYIELDPNYSIVEMAASGELVGKSLRELNLRARLGINVLAFRRGEAVNVSPGGDDVVQEGDVLVVLGSNDAIGRLERLRGGE
ncbi:MAG: TrkA family potassium uptake protein [Acetobacteraceae bacterium]|nr:TrkA family potassium uptake protein [Acetobacteraceae bacterium]